MFSVIPTFLIRNRQIPPKKARLQAILDARVEMGNIFAEQRITMALKSKLRPSFFQDIKDGDDALVYREKNDVRLFLI